MDGRRIEHFLGKEHPDGIGHGFLVEDPQETSENPLHLTGNGICPNCDTKTSPREDNETKRAGGWIESCKKCDTDYLVRI
jgi:hypothetical protein